MLRADWEFSQGKASITGPLSRGTVMALWDEWKQKSTHPEKCLIDLSKIERIDSAGVVMLMHLIEFEKKHNCHVEVSGVPRQLVTLLELSNVANIYREHVADDISKFLKKR